MWCYFIRYEESQLHESIYELHVKLLGTDKTTVLSEHTVKPTEDLSVYSHNWKEVGFLSPSDCYIHLPGSEFLTICFGLQVSHVFSNYGPGVRYVHFQHRLKNSFLNDFFPTRFTGSSVIVKPVKTSSKV